MITLNTIKPNFGARKKAKRIWRWNWSNWTYCWRWMNWQNSRSWGWVGSWFEGWQTPLFRRTPKLKGFSNAKFKKIYSEVNISQLEMLANKWIVDIDKQILLDNLVVRNKNYPVKVLWDWELTKKINIKVSKITKSAKEAIEKLWWKIDLV